MDEAAFQSFFDDLPKCLEILQAVRFYLSKVAQVLASNARELPGQANRSPSLLP